MKERPLSAFPLNLKSTCFTQNTFPVEIEAAKRAVLPREPATINSSPHVNPQLKGEKKNPRIGKLKKKGGGEEQHAVSESFIPTE